MSSESLVARVLHGSVTRRKRRLSSESNALARKGVAKDSAALDSIQQSLPPCVLGSGSSIGGQCLESH